MQGLISAMANGSPTHKHGSTSAAQHSPAELEAQGLKTHANSLLGQARHEEALASYDLALGLAPNDTSILFNRGLALLALKRPQEDLESYDRVLAFAPDDAEALTQRGNALLDLKRSHEALDS